LRKPCTRRRLLIVRDACTYTMQELTDYRWDSKAAATGVERPLKRNDHGADALRYAVSTLWPRIAKVNKISMRADLRIY